MEDHIEYLHNMMNGIAKYQELKLQLLQLENDLMDEQDAFEYVHFSSGQESCVKDSIVELIRDEMEGVGL